MCIMGIPIGRTIEKYRVYIWPVFYKFGPLGHVLTRIMGNPIGRTFAMYHIGAGNALRGSGRRTFATQSRH